jgi:hypothetical protein
MVTAATVATAQRAHVGARVGYDLHSRNVLVSTQATVPITNRAEFYPSLDVYLPDNGSMTGFNGDVKYRFPSTVGAEMYIGGGVGVLNRSVAGNSDTSVGANALVGVESRSGWVHPFLEGRALMNDQTRVQMIGGLNFTIGGR